MRLSVIIPTLNAEKELPGLLQALSEQTVRADEILVVDSESSDRTVAVAEEAGRALLGGTLRVLPILRKDFDHGRTRDWALRLSKGEFIIFLTQDAIPANPYCLENLLRAVQQEKAAVVTGRQLPKKNATPMEKLIREFNYPETSHLRTEADVARMGIKTFFCSDVCAAYNREIYLELGGFEYPLKTNEDMFFAAAAIRKGYRVGYAGDALVYHSHNFTLKEQYARNRIQGYEIEKHKSLLGDVSQMSEGWRLVRYVSAGLLKKGRVISFIRFGLDCCARLFGSKAGKRKAIREAGAS